MTSSQDLYQKSFFDKRKNQYDDKLHICPNLHVIEELNFFINKLKISKYVVDFGSGNGRLTIPLLKQNIKVTAIDISKKSLTRLLYNAKKANNVKNLKVGNDVRKIKQATYIVGMDILHHIDQSVYIPVIYDALKKKGKILFSEPNFWHFFWWLHIFIKGNWKIERGITQCTYFRLINLLNRSGFKKIKITGFGLLPPPLFNHFSILARINYWLGDTFFLKFFAFRFFIEAEK